jgi:ferredoxin-NADP reductase
MAGAALLGRLTWRVATVTAVVDETPRVRTLELEIPGWSGHLAGQHVDVRLTAEDGFRAERAYSLASAPGEAPAITVERLEDGEVSPYLTGEVRPGDAFEVRGPIGGYFVWRPDDGGPLFLAAGGSGVAPMRAILRHRRNSKSEVRARLLYSSRTLEDVIYRAELEGEDVVYTLTRARPAGWTGYTRRVDTALLREIAWPVTDKPLAFVCGPTSFVESVAASLVELGYPPGRIRTERFGATGRP